MDRKKVVRRAHLRKKYRGRWRREPIAVRGCEYYLSLDGRSRKGLGKYGYSLRKPARERRGALLRALAVEGYVWVLGRMKALQALYSGNRSALQKLKLDMRWLIGSISREKRRCAEDVG